MAQIKPEYEAIEEFTNFAKQIVDKYPDVFYGVDVNSIRCVAITNKDRKVSKDCLWELKGVQMPIKMDCPYSYYVIIYSSDWEEMSEKHKLLMISEVLCGISKEGDGEGKVNPMDSKGYKIMYRTFKSIDYLQEADVPDILREDIEWKVSAKHE